MWSVKFFSAHALECVTNLLELGLQLLQLLHVQLGQIDLLLLRSAVRLLGHRCSDCVDAGRGKIWSGGLAGKRCGDPGCYFWGKPCEENNLEEC